LLRFSLRRFTGETMSETMSAVGKSVIQVETGVYGINQNTIYWGMKQMVLVLMPHCAGVCFWNV
jgi:hypothetical protein